MSDSNLKPADSLFNFTLPPKYAPGTDIMSKWILYNKQVANIIVSKLVGK
jgi:hypothetical protein